MSEEKQNTEINVDVALCPKCKRPMSEISGTCYYCRELPPAEEAKIKLMMVKMENDEEKRAKKGVGLNIIVKFSFIGTSIAFLLLLSKYKAIPGVNIPQSALGLILPGFCLLLHDRHLTRNQTFCLLVSTLTFLCASYFAAILYKSEVLLLSTALFGAISALTSIVTILMQIKQEDEE